MGVEVAGKGQAREGERRKICLFGCMLGVSDSTSFVGLFSKPSSTGMVGCSLLYVSKGAERLLINTNCCEMFLT